MVTPRTAPRHVFVALTLAVLCVGASAFANDDFDSKLALDQLSQSEWEHVLAAPSLSGPSGLQHVISAQSVLPRSILAGVLFEGFSSKPFLFSAPPDNDFRLNHGLGVIVGGPDIPFLRQAELYLTLGGSYNRNLRNDSARRDPVAITSIGNLQFGAKLGWLLPHGLSVGGRLGLRFWNAPVGTPFKAGALAGLIDALASLDLLRVSRVPLRLNLNLGGQVDNSGTLLSGITCPGSTSLDACFRSRAAEAFAYQVSQSQLRLAFGVELPFRFVTSGGYLGVSVIAEYMAAWAVGAGDTVIARAGAAADSVSSRTSQLATAAVRLRPGARFVIDLAADIGIASTSLRFGSLLPPWQARLGISYSYDFDGVHVTAAPPPTDANAEAIPEPAPETPASAPVAAIAEASLQPAEPASQCEPAPKCQPVAKCDPAPKCEPAPVREPSPTREPEAKAQSRRRSETGSVPEPTGAAAPVTKPKHKHRPHIKHEGVLLGVDDPIYFRGATMLVPPDSLRVLADVAAYVKTQPNIAVVRVAVLGDDPAARHTKLAHDRMQVVVKYLLSQGVPPEKIQVSDDKKSPPKPAVPPSSEPPIELRIFVSLEI